MPEGSLRGTRQLIGFFKIIFELEPYTRNIHKERTVQTSEGSVLFFLIPGQIYVRIPTLMNPKIYYLLVLYGNFL